MLLRNAQQVNKIHLALTVISELNKSVYSVLVALSFNSRTPNVFNSRLHIADLFLFHMTLLLIWLRNKWSITFTEIEETLIFW